MAVLSVVSGHTYPITCQNSPVTFPLQLVPPNYRTTPIQSVHPALRHSHFTPSVPPSPRSSSTKPVNPFRSPSPPTRPSTRPSTQPIHPASEHLHRTQSQDTSIACSSRTRTSHPAWDTSFEPSPGHFHHTQPRTLPSHPAQDTSIASSPGHFHRTQFKDTSIAPSPRMDGQFLHPVYNSSRMDGGFTPDY